MRAFATPALLPCSRQVSAWIRRHATVAAPVAALIALFAGGFAAPAEALVVKKCDPVAARDITKAHDYIIRHMNKILASMPKTELTPNHKKKIRNRMSKKRFKYVCKDNNFCKRSAKAGVGGRAVHGQKRVQVCYYNTVNVPNIKMCDLVGIIMHEVGHLVGVPRMRGHNNLSDADKKRDLVYKLGFNATDYCEAKTPKFNVALRGKAGLDIGDKCSSHSQCRTRKCEGKRNAKICVCKNNGDCDDNERCRKRGQNICVPKRS